MRRLVTALFLSLVVPSCAVEQLDDDGSDPSGGKADDPDATCAIDPTRSLLIRDPAIVDDARTRGTGPWAITHLLGEMTPPDVTPKQLAVTMGATWFVPDHALTCTPGVDPGCWPERIQLTDLASAPIRLVAIVNRLDLVSAENPVGELRFIYQFFHDVTHHSALRAGVDPRLAAFLNFEFDLSSVRDTTGAPIARETWARWFHELDALSLGSPEYMTKLESITRAVTRRGAAPARINNSALRVVRTSFENWYPSADMWELMSLELAAPNDPSVTIGFVPAGSFVSSGLDKTPNDPDNGWWNARPYQQGDTTSLISVLVDHEAEVLAGTLDFPRRKVGQALSTDPVWRESRITAMNGSGQWLPSAGMFSHNQLPPGFSKERWDTMVTALGKRTCNGCHGFHTNTSGNHFEPRFTGQASEVSAHVTSELPKRAATLRSLACD
jgi:hypothetical protein